MGDDDGRDDGSHGTWFGRYIRVILYGLTDRDTGTILVRLLVVCSFTSPMKARCLIAISPSLGRVN